MEESSTATVSQNYAEKRKHKRYRLMEKLLVRMKDGVAHIGTSFEISQGGMSAVFVEANLPVGAQVELIPVLGYAMKAVIRRRQKNIYGFQFLELVPVDQLMKKCKDLPEFRSMLDI